MNDKNMANNKNKALSLTRLSLHTEEIGGKYFFLTSSANFSINIFFRMATVREENCVIFKIELAQLPNAGNYRLLSSISRA